jgi:hypothetical protein
LGTRGADVVVWMISAVGIVTLFSSTVLIDRYVLFPVFPFTQGWAGLVYFGPLAASLAFFWVLYWWRLKRLLLLWRKLEPARDGKPHVDFD